MDTNSMGINKTPRIYAEIEQTRPFARPQHVALVTLTRTADVLRHALERDLAPHGVSPEQYNVLRILRGAGKNGHPTLEIARRMISRSPNVTRLIDKLVAGGLARREPGTRDRRQAFVHLTAAGRRQLETLDQIVEESREQLSLTDRESATLVRLLDKIREGVARPTAAEQARASVERRASRPPAAQPGAARPDWYEKEILGSGDGGTGFSGGE
jgi:DNA-binding MarR family transcriptional regulator